MTRRKVVIESESVIEPHQAGGQKEKGQLRAVRTASARLPLMKNWLCSVSSVPLPPSFPGSFKSAAHFVISFQNLLLISYLYSASTPVKYVAVISASQILVFCG